MLQDREIPDRNLRLDFEDATVPRMKVQGLLPQASRGPDRCGGQRKAAFIDIVEGALPNRLRRNLLACEAGRHRRTGHRRRNGRRHPEIHEIGEDAIAPDVGGRDRARQSFRGRDLHLVVDSACRDVEQPSKHARNDHCRVHAIGKIGPAGRHDGGSCSLGALRPNFRFGKGQRQDDRIPRHGGHHRFAQDAAL